jgi:hypothetical protein
MRETDLKGITRRSLLTSAGASVAGMLLAEPSLCATQSNRTATTTPANSSASSLLSSRSMLAYLSVGYAEVGRAGGVPVVLLHGWPYDIHSF